MTKVLKNLRVSSIKIPWRSYKDWGHNDALMYVYIRHWMFLDKKYILKSKWAMLSEYLLYKKS